MAHGSGGEEHLAPVIPLFGGGRSAHADRPDGPERDRAAEMPRRTGEEGLWRSVLLDGPSRVAGPSRVGGLSGAGALSDEDGDAIGGSEELRRQAEEVLVRRLRGKQLSVSEARSVLRETGLDRDAGEQIIDEFQHRGYLDDRTLAQLLVRSGVERRGQGRVALSRTLAQRGIPREVIAEALDELPDDDAERALEYARSRAPGMTDLEHDTALRRLLGQLARRGYGGSVAMNAARTALDEVGRGSGGVRFVDSD